MVEHQYAIIEAPSVLGLRSTGVERLATCVLQNGLAERLHARHACRVAPAERSGKRDATALTLNAEEIASWSPHLADAIEEVLDRGIVVFALVTVRRLGVARALDTALEHVSSETLEGFFVHFDTDSLDDDIMPAVDYHLPDGFTWDEMTSIVGRTRREPPSGWF
jgi:arginase family enzyme